MCASRSFFSCCQIDVWPICHEQVSPWHAIHVRREVLDSEISSDFTFFSGIEKLKGRGENCFVSVSLLFVQAKTTFDRALLSGASLVEQNVGNATSRAIICSTYTCCFQNGAGGVRSGIMGVRARTVIRRDGDY